MRLTLPRFLHWLVSRYRRELSEAPETRSILFSLLFWEGALGYKEQMDEEDSVE